ncbi:glycosyltransferase [Candidatus Nomurabacteria bacterium]|nr:glycosyltransferase [Candidatus Nomurabacteria bacterium]
MITIRILILAGGRGMRLWPYSTERIPKQFLNIGGNASPFIRAVERALLVADKKNIFISTNKLNFLHVKRQLRSIGMNLNQVIVKESDYETGISIFSAIRMLKKEFGTNNNDVLAVFPSDHFIDPLENFKEAFQKAVSVTASNRIVVLGKKPTYPQENFGYITVDKENQDGTYTVRQFVEKPPREIAEKLIDDGSCFWNLGMFIFPVGLMMQEFCDFFGVADEKEIFPEMLTGAAKLSFDKMIIEKTKCLTVIEAKFNWLDIGSWEAFYEMLEKDARENANPREQILVDTKGSLVIESNKPVVAIGLDDVFIINHPNVTLAISRKHVNNLKKAMPILEKKYPRLVKGNPLVSICTAIHSGRQFITEAVESVLSQQYSLIEHVIVDSGNIEDIAILRKNIELAREKLNCNDEKVVDVIHHPNISDKQHEAVNMALEEATGDIIGILNPSDIFEDSTVIRSIVDVMEKEDADVCWADLVYVKQNDTTKITRFWQSTPYRKSLFQKGWMPPHPAFFVRRRVYEKYGYLRTDLPEASTYEFMLRVLERGSIRSCYIPKVVVKIRESDRTLLGLIGTVIKSNIESYRAWKINNLQVPVGLLFMKPLSKLTQLLIKFKVK